MTNEENLIRQAVAEEANQAVDPGIVLAALRTAKRPRRRRTMLVAVAGFAVAAAVVAVVVPLTASRDAAPTPPARSIAPTPLTEQNILLVGMDDYGYTDTVLLVRRGVDGSFRAVSLPRDTFVRIPSHGDAKLNKAYAIGYGTTVDTGVFRPEAAKVLVDTVTELTGAKIDHFAMVTMSGFGKLTDAIGGVDVCLKAATKDQFSNADFPAGHQTLAGAKILAFLRQRHGLPNGDLDRAVRQQAFLRSLITKLAGHNDFTALVNAVRDTVRVDQSWDVLEFANQVAAGVSVQTTTIPIVNVAMQTPHDGDAIQVDPAAVRAFVTKYFSSPAPASGTATSAPGSEDASCVW
jgi:LCP family protein required for cell wall assembly